MSEAVWDYSLSTVPLYKFFAPLASLYILETIPFLGELSSLLDEASFLQTNYY